jgi:hypothetical protein
LEESIGQARDHLWVGRKRRVMGDVLRRSAVDGRIHKRWSELRR